MKHEWDDDRITGLVRSLKDERPPDPHWPGRVWMGIEARLDRREPAFASLFRGASLRWAAGAACLLVALALTVRYQRGQETDLGSYVAQLYQQEAVPSVNPVESLLFSDGSGLTPVGYEESEESMPSVYDTMMEI